MIIFVIYQPISASFPRSLHLHTIFLAICPCWMICPAGTCPWVIFPGAFSGSSASPFSSASSDSCIFLPFWHSFSVFFPLFLFPSPCLLSQVFLLHSRCLLSLPFCLYLRRISKICCD